MKNWKTLERERAGRLRGLAMVGLALVALILLPALIAALFMKPVLVAGGLVLAAAPIALTEEQVAEFKSILGGLAEYKEMFPKLKDLGTVEGGFAAIKQLPTTLKELAEGYKKLQEDNSKMKKTLLSRNTGSGVTYRRKMDGTIEPFVSDDCARAFASIYMLQCAQRDLWPAGFREEGAQKRAFDEACDLLSMNQKTALTATEIPVPTVYVPQIVELVWNYGQMRQYGTTWPLGAGTVKLPRLKAGEDAFAFLGVGTAGMSQAVPQKKVTAELVTFTANKFGGLIIIPTELEQDTFIAMGQFLARYIARRFAFGEDDTAFNGDGTATYANITGVKTYCTTNTAYLEQLGAGKTKPSDATLNNFRNLRARVSAAALAESAYYMNITMDALLCTFNTIGAPQVYQRNGMNATLDGYPIRWTGVHQAYGTAAAASAHLASFGALSYTYLGERGQPRVESSRDVYFATDEIALRALERIDVEQMAIDSIAALLTAAA